MRNVTSVFIENFLQTVTLNICKFLPSGWLFCRLKPTA